MVTASPDDALQKFDALSKNYSSSIRSLRKDLERNTKGGNEDEVNAIKSDIDNNLETFVPVLMSQASIHWERGDYAKVEKVLRQSQDIYSDEEEWKLNIAHALFVQQGSKFKECIEYYEPFVDVKGVDSI